MFVSWACVGGYWCINIPSYFDQHLIMALMNVRGYYFSILLAESKSITDQNRGKGLDAAIIHFKKASKFY